MTDRAPTSSSATRGWWLCAGAAVLFGSSTPATKRLLGDTPATTIAGLLYLGAAVAVAPWALRQRPRRTAVRERLMLLAAVGLGGGLGPVLLVSGLRRTPAGTAALLLNAELLATALVAWAFLHEHIGRRTAAGLALVVAGAVIVTGTGGTHMVGGALLVVAACACWGVDNALTARLDAFAPATVTFAKGAVAGTVNLALGLTGRDLPAAHVVVGTMLVGAFGYGLSITLWIGGARLVGAARGQAVFALAPFAGAALAWPVNGDRPSPGTALGFVVSLAGVLVAAGDHRHHHVHSHGPTVHRHRIDADDPHHRPDAIDVLDGTLHRHHPLTHEHEHLPDVHHRHEHDRHAHPAG